jgi:hypothetical protein
LGEAGTTIQDILNSMPFSLKKASGLDEGKNEQEEQPTEVTFSNFSKTKINVRVTGTIFF